MSEVEQQKLATDLYRLGYEAGELESMGLVQLDTKNGTYVVLPPGYFDPRVKEWECMMLAIAEKLGSAT